MFEQICGRESPRLTAASFLRVLQQLFCKKPARWVIFREFLIDMFTTGPVAAKLEASVKCNLIECSNFLGSCSRRRSRRVLVICFAKRMQEHQRNVSRIESAITIQKSWRSFAARLQATNYFQKNLVAYSVSGVD